METTYCILENRLLDVILKRGIACPVSSQRGIRARKGDMLQKLLERRIQISEFQINVFPPQQMHYQLKEYRHPDQ